MKRLIKWFKSLFAVSEEDYNKGISKKYPYEDETSIIH